MAEKTGWSKNDILKCSLPELLIYLADAPKLKKGKPPQKKLETDEDLLAFGEMEE